MIKRYADDRHKTASYEHGLLEQLTVQHLHDLGTPWVGAFAQETHYPTKAQRQDLQAVIGPSLDNVKVSSSCRIKGKLICANDVVRYTSKGVLAIGQIKYFVVASNGAQYALLFSWKVIAKTEMVARCTVQIRFENLVVTPLHSLTNACIFLKAADGEISTVFLRP